MRKTHNKSALGEIFIALIFLLIGNIALTANQNDPDNQIGIDEKLGEIIPLDIKFIDSNGDTLLLADYIDKPTVVTLVYYNCPGICTPLLGEMTDLVDKMDLKPGIDYKILTISFNHKDTPAIAKEKKRNFMKGLLTQFPEDQWKWATGDSVTIRRFTDAVGFIFMPDSNNFAHPTSLIVLSKEGKITRYLYGIKQLPFDLKMAIIEASEGRVGPSISKILQFCFSYDREGDKYAFNFTRVGGGIILIFLAVFLAGISIRGRNKRNKERH